MSLRTKSLVRVVMNAGEVGKWNVDIDQDTSINLSKKDAELTWTQGSVESGDYGSFQELQNFCDFDIWYFAGEGLSNFTPDNNMVREALLGWGSSKDIIGDKVLEAFRGLTTTIIMPAGDVFTFAGLDTDDAGNVYTQINFANDGGIKIVKGGNLKT